MKNNERLTPIDYEPEAPYIKGINSFQEFCQLLENNFESVVYICMNGDDRSPAVAKSHNNLEQLKHVEAVYIPGGIHTLDSVILPKDRKEKYNCNNKNKRKQILDLLNQKTLWVFVAEEGELNNTNFLAYVAYLKNQNDQATIAVYPYSKLYKDYSLGKRDWLRGGTTF